MVCSLTVGVHHTLGRLKILKRSFYYQAVFGLVLPQKTSNFLALILLENVFILNPMIIVLNNGLITR